MYLGKFQENLDFPLDARAAVSVSSDYGPMRPALKGCVDVDGDGEQW